jgi:rhodanese-related sulfurtransferase
MTDVSKLDATTVRRRLAETSAPRLLDVRTPAEFAAMHIPGSYNVPLDTLKEHRDELRRHLDEVILVCRTGGRATTAERTLAEVGMVNLHILDGGITAWHAAGGPVNHGKPGWDLERQVRLVAGSLVLTGIVAGVAVPPLKWLSAAVGTGLVISALTNTCTMGMLLSKLPFNRGTTCDVNAVIQRLAHDGSAE